MSTRTDKEILQEQVCEGRRYADSVTAASGNVLKDALVNTFWFAPAVAAVCNAFSGAVGIGGYLATASAGAILLGGLLQISERLADVVENSMRCRRSARSPLSIGSSLRSLRQIDS